MTLKEKLELECFRATSYDALGGVCFIDWKKIIDAFEKYNDLRDSHEEKT